MEILSNPIENWLNSLEKLGMITKEKIKFLMEIDNSKLERLERLNNKLGLPIIKYLVIDGDEFDEMNSNMKSFFSSDDLFAIRAVPKDSISGLVRVRKHGISKEECLSLIKKLQGINNYIIYLNKFFRTEYGGTIINDGERIFIELATEDHFKLSQHDLPKDRLFKGFLDKNGIVFNRDDERLKEIVLGGLKFLRKRDSRSSNGFLFGYFEFLYNKKDEYVFFDYNDTDLFTNLKKIEIKSTSSNSSALLRGSVIYPGKVSGKVNIIKNFQESDKFKDGNILVTRMLSPDFLSLMRKSKAIITDLGGLTSHGAIIARELKVPCIFGTKDATKKLKDNDSIYMNAEGMDGLINKM